MGIGSIAARDIGTQSAKKAGARAESAMPHAPGKVAKVLDKSKPMLKLILGKDWADFLTRDPLHANLQDEGPQWLQEITTRLDGKKRESVGLTLRVGTNIPTPVPGLTLVANHTSEATLRRTPRGALQLIYANEMDPGVAAQLHLGLVGGFSVGNVGFKAGGVAQAGVQGQALIRSSLVYDIDPRNPEEMASLARQIKGHLVIDSHKAASAVEPQGVLASMRGAFKGKEALAEVPAAPSGDLGSEFAQRHLSQASFFRGVRLNANTNVWGGLSINRGEQVGMSGDGEGLGLDWKQAAKPSNKYLEAGSLKSMVGSGLDVMNSILAPTVGGGASLDRGLEHTLDFDRGTYRKTTVAINSDKSLYGFGGAYGGWWEPSATQGHRYAVTYGPKGLQSVDYSVRTSVGQGLKRKSQLAKQFGAKIDRALPKERPADPLVLTYSANLDTLTQLKHMSPEELQSALPAVFERRNAFDLTRLVSSHGERFEVGSWFGVGLGPFVGGSVFASADHTEMAVKVAKHAPGDPLPAERPWSLRPYLPNPSMK